MSHAASSSGMSTLRSPWRWPAAVTLVVAAIVHIPVTPEHIEEAPYIGYLFVALTVVCLVLAVAIAAFDPPLIWVSSGLVTALAVLAYVLSRSIALPQIGDDVGNWFEPLGVLAVASEAMTVAFAIIALRRTKVVWRRSTV